MSTITTINATDKPRLSREVINTNFANLNAGKAEITDVVLLAGSYANPTWITSLSWAKITGAPPTYAPSAHVHPTADITSGTFADARIAASNVTQHQAALALAASQITSGSLALARGGTGADLSATGGTGFVLKQSSAGATISVAALVAADIPSLDTAKITTGTFADSRIAASNVTQHQAALSIASTQVTGQFVGATKLSDYSTAFVTSLTGTPNRVTVSGANGAITLNGPQDLHTAASPTFASLTLSGANYPTVGLFSTAGGAALSYVSAYTGASFNRLFLDVNRRTSDGVFGDAAKTHAGIYIDVSNANGQIGFRTSTTNNAIAPIQAILYGTGNWMLDNTGDSGYRLDVAKSGSAGTARFYDQTATTGSTSLVVRAGAGQSTNNWFALQNNAGTSLIYAYPGSSTNSTVVVTHASATSDLKIANISSEGWVYTTGSSQLNLGVGGNVVMWLTSAGYVQFATSARVGFFGVTPVARPAALTAANNGTLNTGDATSDTIIGNMRTRIAELESKLQAYGLLN